VGTFVFALVTKIPTFLSLRVLDGYLTPRQKSTAAILSLRWGAPSNESATPEKSFCRVFVIESVRPSIHNR
jgi:hypothetical protein